VERCEDTNVESVSSSHPPNAEDCHAQESILVRHVVFTSACVFQLVLSVTLHTEVVEVG
jgi:hypothetical protein